MNRMLLGSIVLFALATAACTADSTPDEPGVAVAGDDQEAVAAPAQDEPKAPKVEDQGAKPANNALYGTNPLY